MNGFSDANWFSLEQSAKDGNIIPIIGPDALVVEYKGQPVPFYRLVTEELLKNFQIEPDPEIVHHTWSLHKSVSAILAKKGGQSAENQIRNEIIYLVDKYSKETQPTESLRLLANIPTFTLYVSLTPDNLLERAMKMTSDPSPGICATAFWPRNDSKSLDHLPVPRPGERSIFQMLGSCTSGFAMHEEEALESLYLLQTKAPRYFSDILSELRPFDKLFINCNFPDWLGRAMLRLVNEDRLYVIHKDTQEFICPSANDAGLSAFLTQYSPSTMGLEGKVDNLIQRLARSLAAASPSLKPSAAPRKAPSSHGPTVFVSYASENADAARSIADTLLKLGFSDVWLDKKKLIGGDDWSDRIDKAIEKCDFFIPILSREADSRREGVFWDEWKTAAERARRIKDAFLLPVGIDAEFPDKNNYRRISDGDSAVFFSKHSFHAPRGILSTEDCEAFSERCRRFEEESHG